MPKPMSWCYIAAFLEADGSIIFENMERVERRQRIRIKWIQEEKYSFVLYGIQEFLEEHGIKSYIYVRKATSDSGFKRNSQYVWLELSRREDVLKVLKNILPYMWIKDNKAKLAIENLYESLGRRSYANPR